MRRLLAATVLAAAALPAVCCAHYVPQTDAERAAEYARAQAPAAAADVDCLDPATRAAAWDAIRDVVDAFSRDDMSRAVAAHGLGVVICAIQILETECVLAASPRGLGGGDAAPGA